MACSALPLEIAQNNLTHCFYVAVHCKQHGEIRIATEAAPSGERYCCPVCQAPCQSSVLGEGGTHRALPFFGGKSHIRWDSALANEPQSQDFVGGVRYSSIQRGGKSFLFGRRSCRRLWLQGWGYLHISSRGLDRALPTLKACFRDLYLVLPCRDSNRRWRVSHEAAIYFDISPRWGG